MKILKFYTNTQFKIQILTEPVKRKTSQMELHTGHDNNFFHQKSENKHPFLALMTTESIDT